MPDGHGADRLRMFDALKNMLSGASADTAHHGHFDPGDYRLVATALLVHAAAIDGEANAKELDKIHAVVRQRFNLEAAEADELIAEATAAENNAIDLCRFTSQLNRTLGAKSRARVIEMMWQVVFSDGQVSEFEDNLVWRVADLLGISGEERVALRQRVGAQK